MKIKTLKKNLVNRRNKIRKIYLLLFMSIFMFSLVSAVNPCGNDNSYLGEFKQGVQVNLVQNCEDCTYVNLTKIVYPDSSFTNYNTELTQSGTEFNISLGGSKQLGCHSYTICGNKGGSVQCETINYLIKSKAGDADRGINTSSILMILVVLIGLFVWKSVDHLWGSIVLIISGMGILFTIPAEGWIGWVIIGTGLMMLFSALLSTGNKR